MKLRFTLLGLLSFIAVSCSYEESFVPKDNIDNSAVEFYATIDEQPDADTKVYADDQLRVLWNEDDRITIFSKFTYNQEYRFLGEDGDNAGAFRKVPNDDYVTGNDLPKSYAIYPYLESTKISNDGMITFTLPSEQIYHPDSFGIGANTMVSASETNELRFKNVGGYLSLKFYGEGVSISSIALKGNNGELLAGKCSIDMSSGLPVLSLDDSKATDAITLVCDPAVDLGNSSSDAIAFWFVLPPVTFTKGITVTVNTKDGGVFEKSTSNKLEIGRSAITKLGALEVVPEYSQPNNVIYYTSTDGNIVTPYKTDVFGANIVSNDYVDGQGVLIFDSVITSIGSSAFYARTSLASIALPESVITIGDGAFSNCTSLTSVVVPESVTSIGVGAFINCTSLASIALPESVTRIEKNAFSLCKGLTSFVIPESVTSIGEYAFDNCTSLASIVIPESVTSIEGFAFQYCTSLASIFIPEGVTSIERFAFYCSGLTSIVIPYGVITIGTYAFTRCSSLASVVIPEGVIVIGEDAFSGCTSLTSIVIPQSVTTIGDAAFYGCNSLDSIICKPESPPLGGGGNMFYYSYCPIYVPDGSVEAYKTAQYWNDFASRIQAIPSTGEIDGYAYVDMGNGLKWATMNVGASSPEEYGDFFAWGETDPKENYNWATYKHIDPNNTFWTGINKYQTEDNQNSVLWYSNWTFVGDGKTSFEDYFYEDDAARKNWGGTWRTPTDAEWTNLRDSNQYEWKWIDNYNGTRVNGYTVTSKVPGYVDNQIFLPAAGHRDGTSLHSPSSGYYWSSSLTSYTNNAWSVYFYSSHIYRDFDSRYYGMSVRPVSD